MMHPTCQIPTIDKIYSQYFKGKGCFVEVGAFDGMTYGCTWGLAVDGWKGFYIEPLPEFYNQCILNHKGHDVETINCACGDYNGFIDLTVFGEVSTTVLSRWTKDWGMDENTPKIKVPIFTLDFLIEEYNIPQIDLLVIDVEEAEIQVLKGFNVSKHRPKMIIIELHETQGTGPDQKGWQTPWVDEYLKGYKKIYKDQINTIYVLTK